MGKASGAGRGLSPSSHAIIDRQKHSDRRSKLFYKHFSDYWLINNWSQQLFTSVKCIGCPSSLMIILLYRDVSCDKQWQCAHMSFVWTVEQSPFVYRLIILPSLSFNCCNWLLHCTKPLGRMYFFMCPFEHIFKTQFLGWPSRVLFVDTDYHKILYSWRTEVICSVDISSPAKLRRANMRWWELP